MTEKNYNPEQMAMKSMKKQETVQQEFHQQHAQDKSKKETESKTEEQKKHVPKEKPRKTQAVVNAFDVPISTKHSAAICRFVKRKEISQAITDLEQVAKLKKPIPMKGEIPHRHGKMMSGRFPVNATKQFIILLKSLSANSSYNGLENPVIVEAVANIGARPFGRGGIRRKRTHVRIVAENKKTKEKQ